GTLVVILSRGYTTADMDAVLAKLEQLVAAETKSEMNAVLGTPAKEVKPLPFVDEVRKSFPSLRPVPAKDEEKESPLMIAAAAPDQLEMAWVSQDVAAVKNAPEGL